MQIHPVVVVGLLGALFLAGCAQSGDGTASSSSPDSFRNVQTAPDTGIIKGVVVSESITPIPGANVQLAGQKLNKTTDKDGAFVFTDLKAGTYFLKVTKAGHLAQQTSTTVVEGETDVKTLKVILPVDRASLPFAQLYKWDGFLECGVGLPLPDNPVSHGGVNPCAVDGANSHNTQAVEVSVPLTMAQLELRWDGSQALGNSLSIGILDPNQVTPADFAHVAGQSPVILPVDGKLIQQFEGNATSMLERVFPAANGQTPVLILNQRFTVYTTEFHGFVPRAGWAFVTDGECTGPADCGAK